MDSSSIVSCVQNNFRNYIDDINTFSLITTDFPECNEGFYIQKVAELEGVKSYFLTIDEISPLDDFENVDGILSNHYSHLMVHFFGACIK